MDLDPAAVEQELQIVQEACDEVSARLSLRRQQGKGRPRDNALPPLPSTHTVDGKAPLAVPVDPHDRNSSRRFVHRDWNVARRRTQAGLFVDDQALEAQQEAYRSQRGGDTAAGGTTMPPDPGSAVDQSSLRLRLREREDGEVPRTQPGPPSSYEHGSREPGEVGAADAAGSFRRRSRGDSHLAGNPRLDIRSRLGAVQDGPGRGGRRDGGAGGWPVMRVWPGRAGVGPRLQRGHSAPAPLPPAGPPPGAMGLQAAGEQVVGEAAGQEPMQEEFTVERRRERPAGVELQTRRNKRMFGALLGHLDGFERQCKRLESTGVVSKRRQLEEAAAARAEEEDFRARQKARKQAQEAREADIAMKRELVLQHNMKQAKLLCAQKIAHTKSLLKFIRTKTTPPLLWEPVAVNEDVERMYKQQQVEFEAWADEAARRLQAEQKEMRRRAELRWKELDDHRHAREAEAEDRIHKTWMRRRAQASLARERGSLRATLQAGGGAGDRLQPPQAAEGEAMRARTGDAAGTQAQQDLADEEREKADWEAEDDKIAQDEMYLLDGAFGDGDPGGAHEDDGALQGADGGGPPPGEEAGGEPRSLSDPALDQLPRPGIETEPDGVDEAGAGQAAGPALGETEQAEGTDHKEPHAAQSLECNDEVNGRGEVGNEGGPADGDALREGTGVEDEVPEVPGGRPSIKQE